MVDRVIFPFRGAELGGSHLATFTLATALQRRSAVECVILCPANTLIMEEAERLDLRTVSSGEAPTGQNNLVTDFSRIPSRRKILEGEHTAGGAIVHCNDVNTLRAWGLAARLSGMNVVYHHHALNRMWWPPHLLSLSYADAVICVSDGTMEAIRRWRGDAVKELNPFDLDATFHRTAAHQNLLSEFGWPSHTKVVGWIGNFWERKRPFFFLETAAAIVRRAPEVRFVMFGRDGDHSSADIRQRAAKLGLSDVIAIPGFRQPVEANLASIDLLLAPAPREPFGRALVEAIILGTPVVATRGAGHSEIIGAWGGGELANETDTAEEVAQLCLVTLAAPDRYRLTKGRREALAADLAPDAYADRILGLYQRLSRAPTLPSRPWVATRLASADANDSHDHRFQHRNGKREQDPR